MLSYILNRQYSVGKKLIKKLILKQHVVEKITKNIHELNIETL
jgi:hypothetical protein